MRMPGFTAELAAQDRSTMTLWVLRPAKSALAEIAPQLIDPTHPIPCPWPPCVVIGHKCVCYV